MWGGAHVGMDVANGCTRSGWINVGYHALFIQAFWSFILQGAQPHHHMFMDESTGGRDNSSIAFRLSHLSSGL